MCDICVTMGAKLLFFAGLLVVTSTETVDTNTMSSDPPTSMPTAEEPSTGCVLPNITGGATKFCSLDDGCDEDCDFYNRRCHIPPGTRTPSSVKIACQEGHIYDNGGGDYPLALCHSSRWLPPITPCIKVCKPMFSDELQLDCHYNDAIAPCSSQSWKPGTWVGFRCRPGYSEIPTLKMTGAYQKRIVCKQNGEWSDNLPCCKPGCGVSRINTTEDSPTIAEGQEAVVGSFPWHAGLYYRQEKDGKVFWDQKCAGTLITDRVILTAAHCVSGRNMSDIQVALGKYHRSWDVAEPTEVKRNISDIQITPYYDDRVNAFDAALILLSQRITIGEHVMPACRDHDVNATQPRRPTSGPLHVAGWEQTGSNAAASETLLHNTFTVLSEDECKERSPVGTVDKMCAHVNNSDSTVQYGDSGAGVTAVYADGLHYDVGIVSYSGKPGEPGADTVFFTNITRKLHFYWIQRQLRSWANFEILD